MRRLLRTLISATLLLVACGPKAPVRPLVGGEGPVCEPREVPDDLEAWTLPARADRRLLAPPSADPRAPDLYDLVLNTTAGRIVVRVHRDWSPGAADRLHLLAELGFFEGAPLFRAVPDFMVQFGIPAWPEVDEVWSRRNMPNEPEEQPVLKGTLAMARGGAPDSRTTQFFIAAADARFLGRSGYGAVGEVVEGMDVLARIEACYGEGQPRGSGPGQTALHQHGGAYVQAGWPELDLIRGASVREVRE